MTTTTLTRRSTQSATPAESFPVWTTSSIVACALIAAFLIAVAHETGAVLAVIVVVLVHRANSQTVSWSVDNARTDEVEIWD